MRALSRTKARSEDRNNLHDEWFQRWRGRAHNGEVNFKDGPVCRGAGVPCLVCGVLGHEDEEVEADDGDDDDEPAESEDDEQRDALALGDLEVPDLPDGERGDEEVGGDI